MWGTCLLQQADPLVFAVLWTLILVCRIHRWMRVLTPHTHDFTVRIKQNFLGAYEIKYKFLVLEIMVICNFSVTYLSNLFLSPFLLFPSCCLLTALWFPAFPPVFMIFPPQLHGPEAYLLCLHCLSHHEPLKTSQTFENNNSNNNINNNVIRVNHVCLLCTSQLPC